MLYAGPAGTRMRRRVELILRGAAGGRVAERFLICGSGGREAAFASRLAEDARLYAVVGHENPGIVDSVDRSGGAYAVGDAGDPGAVAAFAKRHSVDYALVNADQPLANGVVDALLGAGIRTAGATRAASRVEWDKIYSTGLVERACPEIAPLSAVARSGEEADAAVDMFRSRGMQVVVKPEGLTGGKGVKVMPEHLATHADAAAYARSLLAKGRPGGGVLLVERLEGAEFTIMGITDGRRLELAPATYDYPYRLEGDAGPGTGGMGCFTEASGRLPFLSDADVERCRSAMERVVAALRDEGHPFNGVLNGGFFKTAGGIRFMEFNARFGDPEVLNVLSVMEGRLSDVVAGLAGGALPGGAARFAKKASVTKYLVAKEYPGESEHAVSFSVDEEAVASAGVDIIPASCVRAGAGGGGRYETIRKSRAMAFGAVAGAVEEAAGMVDAAIDGHFKGALEYRRDIGSAANLERLRAAVPG